MRKRLAAILLAAPLALAPAGSADAAINVLPGCWGAVWTFCDVTVHEPIAWYSFGTPVCAGTCTWVSVPYPFPSGQTCVSYGDAYGGYTQFCT